jgi:hypothetical protein
MTKWDSQLWLSSQEVKNLSGGCGQSDQIGQIFGLSGDRFNWAISLKLQYWPYILLGLLFFTEAV